VRIYELLGRKGALVAQAAELREGFEAALGLYRSRKWDEAERRFQRCLAVQPNDGPSKVFLERIGRLRASPPAADWDGAWSIDTK